MSSVPRTRSRTRTLPAEPKCTPSCESCRGVIKEGHCGGWGGHLLLSGGDPVPLCNPSEPRVARRGPPFKPAPRSRDNPEDPGSPKADASPSSSQVQRRARRAWASSTGSGGGKGHRTISQEQTCGPTNINTQIHCSLLVLSLLLSSLLVLINTHLINIIIRM